MIPKPIRDRLGLVPGEIEIEIDGAGIRVEPTSGSGLRREAGRMVIPPSGITIDDDDVRDLRLGDQK